MPGMTLTTEGWVRNEDLQPSTPKVKKLELHLDQEKVQLLEEALKKAGARCPLTFARIWQGHIFITCLAELTVTQARDAIRAARDHEYQGFLRWCKTTKAKDDARASGVDIYNSSHPYYES